MKFQQVSSGLLIPTQPPEPTESPEPKARNRELHIPTLDWFLSLDKNDQEAIWSKLRQMLLWSGWIESQSFRGQNAVDLFFTSLRDAGASWEEYT